MSLYKETLMKHYRNPIHKHENSSATTILDGVNPSCGDNITIYSDINCGVIEDISFSGNGCAISMASADIMCDVIKNRENPLGTINSFLAMLNDEDYSFDEEDKILDIFSELREFPARRSCARLPWRTLSLILEPQ